MNCLGNIYICIYIYIYTTVWIRYINPNIKLSVHSRWPRERLPTNCYLSVYINAEVMLRWSLKICNWTWIAILSPTSFITINVNFDRIQFECYCIYRPNPFLWWKCILFTSKRFLFFRYSSQIILYVAKKTETPKKFFFYEIWNISPNKAPIEKHIHRFGGKPCMYHYQKEKLKYVAHCMVSELNPTL